MLLLSVIFYVSIYVSIYLTVSISLCLSVSVSLVVYLSCLSLCLVFGLSILLSVPFLSNSYFFCPSSQTHTRTIHSRQVWAIRMVCCVALGAEFDVEIRQTWRHINVLNQATSACNSSNTACQQQKHCLSGKLCVTLKSSRHVCINLISQQRQKSCFGSVSVQGSWPWGVIKE